MKRPRREAGGGEVALMAVITKAMGAFLVLVVIMLPHYILVVNNSQSADQAQAAVNQAAANVGEIADRLKKGRLTDREIDDLLHRIEDLKSKLAALNDQIALLRNELNQTLAEVQRLRKTRNELEAEVARLKQELETRKTFEQPVTVAAISWADCPGMNLSVYVYTNYVDPSNGKKQPAPIRQAQKPFWTDERVGGTTVFDAGRSSGHLWWKTPDNGSAETLQLWVQLLNPVNLASAAPRECDVQITLTSKSGTIRETARRVSDRVPFAYVEARKLADGNFATWDPFDRETPFEKVAASYLASPCEKLLCYLGGYGEQLQAPRDGMKEAFVAEIDATNEAGEAPAAVFDEMARGTATVTDAFRWLSVFPRKGAAAPVDFLIRHDDLKITALLDKKNPPYAVRSEIFRLVRQKRLVFRFFETRWQNLKDHPRSTDDLPQAAKDLFREFSDVIDASAKSNALSADEASIWKSSINTLDVAYIRAGLTDSGDVASSDDAIDRKFQTAAASAPKQFQRDRAKTELRAPPEMVAVIKKMIRQRVYELESIQTAFVLYEAKYGR